MYENTLLYLVPKVGAPFDGQRLVGVDESFADGQRLSGRTLNENLPCIFVSNSWLSGFFTFNVHRYERARHWRVAREEEWPPLLQSAREAVADRVYAQIGTVVADANDDRSWAPFP